MIRVDIAASCGCYMCKHYEVCRWGYMLKTEKRVELPLNYDFLHIKFNCDHFEQKGGAEDGEKIQGY